MPRILIAEDEPIIANFIAKGLQSQGYTTLVTASGLELVNLANSKDFDLLILDLSLHDKDGLFALAEIRGRGETLPVIILTARDEISEKVAGFESGANDYLTKPFSFDELLVRIRARLRDHSYTVNSAQTSIILGEISLDLRMRRLQVNGRSFDLSAREFAMLETFMRHPDQVLSREQLLNHVWGYDYGSSTNVVDIYVGYLRKKLGTKRIQTIRGMGFRFRI